MRPDPLVFRAGALDALSLDPVRRRDNSTTDLDAHVRPSHLVERGVAANGFATISGSWNTMGVSGATHNHHRAQRACHHPFRSGPLGWRSVTKYRQRAHNASARRERLRLSDPHRQCVDVAGHWRIPPVRWTDAPVGTADAPQRDCGLCV